MSALPREKQQVRAYNPGGDLVAARNRNDEPAQVPAKPVLAKKIRFVAHRGPTNTFSLEIDGQEFPWYIGDEVTTSLGPNNMPLLRVSLLAETLEVVNDFQ